MQKCKNAKVQGGMKVGVGPCFSLLIPSVCGTVDPSKVDNLKENGQFVVQVLSYMNLWISKYLAYMVIYTT